MTDPVIKVDKVTKIYITGDTKVPALKELDLTVKPGQMAAIMGTSGSGKSTLMHILGCLDRPTSGRYLLNGRDVSLLDRDSLAYIRNRQIGFVFQSFNLLKNTAAWENVCLPLVYTGVPRKEMITRARSALQQVGLQGRESHLPTQLSGGQQQRVAIARALINEPAIILLDEPTGALDTITSIEVMALLQRLHAERGITIIIVTHEHDIAEYCQRVVRLRDGTVVDDGIIEQPRSAEQELSAMPREEGVI
ncbi:MAG: ABC transporter ATP-binding protein [Bacillota bacterium]